MHIVDLFGCYMNVEILKFTRAWIGSPAEHENTFVLLVKEWLKGVGSKIRMNRDSVRLEKVKRILDAFDIRVSGVSIFCVQNNWDSWRNLADIHNGLTKRPPHILTIECPVELVSAHKVFCRFHDCAVKR